MHQRRADDESGSTVTVAAELPKRSFALTNVVSVLAGINAHGGGDAVGTVPHIGGGGTFTLEAKQRRADENTGLTTLSQWVDNAGKIWPIPIYPSDDSLAAQESSEYFEFLSGMLSLPGSYSAEAASILSGLIVSHDISVTTITGPRPTSAPGKRDVEDREEHDVSLTTVMKTEAIWVDLSGSPWGVPVVRNVLVYPLSSDILTPSSTAEVMLLAPLLPGGVVLVQLQRTRRTAAFLMKWSRIIRL